MFFEYIASVAYPELIFKKYFGVKAIRLYINFVVFYVWLNSMSDSRYNHLKGDYFISAASLLLEYRNFIDSHPVLHKVNLANTCWPQIARYCENLAQHESIMRSITRMHTTSQLEFERALFCSWGSLLVARLLNLETTHQQALFYGGLLQDIGQHALHEEESDLSSKSNVAFLLNIPSHQKYIHALQGSSYIESTLPDFGSLSDLVMNHHAKNDGTGYPRHVTESQLNLDNQILIIANEISDRLDQLGGHNQISQVLPNLKIGQFLYFTKAHTAWTRLLGDHTSEAPIKTDGYVIEDLKKKGMKLEKLMSCLLSVSGDLLPYDFNIEVHSLRQMVRKLASLFTDSGVLDTSIFKETGHISIDMMADVNMIFKGLPEILLRCMKLIDEILESKKYDSSINVALISDCRSLLNRNIKSLDGNRCSIFR